MHHGPVAKARLSAPGHAATDPTARRNARHARRLYQHGWACNSAAGAAVCDSWRGSGRRHAAPQFGSAAAGLLAVLSTTRLPAAAAAVPTVSSALCSAGVIRTAAVASKQSTSCSSMASRSLRAGSRSAGDAGPNNSTTADITQSDPYFGSRSTSRAGCGSDCPCRDGQGCLASGRSGAGIRSYPAITPARPRPCEAEGC